MLVTELGMAMDVSPLHPLNAECPILETEFGMMMEVSSPQPANANCSMLVTELGIIVVLHPVIRLLEEVAMIALQLLRLSYTVFSLATTIEVSPLQWLNALSLMLVTELGMVMDVSPLQ